MILGQLAPNQRLEKPLKTCHLHPSPNFPEALDRTTFSALGCASEHRIHHSGPEQKQGNSTASMRSFSIGAATPLMAIPITSAIEPNADRFPGHAGAVALFYRPDRMSVKTVFGGPDPLTSQTTPQRIGVLLTVEFVSNSVYYHAKLT
jgi:hypothetical protein